MRLLFKKDSLYFCPQTKRIYQKRHERKKKKKKQKGNRLAKTTTTTLQTRSSITSGLYHTTISFIHRLTDTPHTVNSIKRKASIRQVNRQGTQKSLRLPSQMSTDISCLHVCPLRSFTGGTPPSHDQLCGTVPRRRECVRL